MNMKLKKTLTLFIALLMGVSVGLLCVPAVAAENGGLSLTVTFADGTGIADAAFSLYAAAYRSSGSYVLTDAFADSSVDINAETGSSGMSDLAETLSAYASAEDVAANQSGRTNEDGRLTFSGLSEGLYLLTAARTETNGFSYIVSPMLVYLSENLTVEVKFEKINITTAKEIEISVDKKWETGGSDEHPNSVTVQLLKDGEVYETVELDESVNWKHTWSELSEIYLWQIIEANVPDDYTVLVRKNGKSYKVTNTLSDSGNDEPEEPNEPSSPKNPSTPTTDPTLPQTGQLNWPIPVLSGSGLALICIGVFLISGGKRRNDGEANHET